MLAKAKVRDCVRLVCAHGRPSSIMGCVGMCQDSGEMSVDFKSTSEVLLAHLKAELEALFALPKAE
jgi:hypothetical protein